ncbi:MAG: phage antirepressor KilAC domain-containing protein [Lutibacter sp.]|nr:phage antirepressor KilAC domain-containing protein [Lutibacter sp.]
MEKNKPKLTYPEMNYKETFSIKETAIKLKLGYGNKTLFKKLRALGILDNHNSPEFEYIKQGYFTTVEKERKYHYQSDTITLVTWAGLAFLQELHFNGYLKK